jgi:hypothetical protein
MKNKATLIHHQGYADLFTNNSICNYYADKYEELNIFVTDESRKLIIENMYRHVKNIKCLIPKTTYEFNNSDSCLLCMTIGSPYACPRDQRNRCVYIDYQNYQEYENIKVGCFREYGKWEKFLNISTSFSHAFYEYENISLEDRLKLFSLNNDIYKQEEAYSNVINRIGKEYIVVHDDPERGMSISLSNNNFPRYDLNKKSNDLIDQIKILENAKEIHFIDSSYSVLTYFLSFKNYKIENIPKFLHTYVRGARDVGIYTNPTPKNWRVL